MPLPAPRPLVANALALLTARATQILLQLALLPLLLRHLGLPAYGLLQTLFCLHAIFTAFDTPLQAALARALIDAGEDPPRRSRALAAGRRLQGAASTCAAIALLACAGALASACGVAGSDRVEYARGIVALACGILACAPLGAYAAVPDALRRQAFSARAHAATEALSAVALLGAAASGGGVPGCVAARFAILAVRGAWVRRWALDALGRPEPGRSGLDACLALGRDAAGFLVQSVSSLTVTALDRLLILRLAGPAAVGLYAVAASVADRTFEGLGALLTAYYPAACAARSGGDESRFRTLFLRTTRASLAALTPITLLLALCGRSLLQNGLRLDPGLAGACERPLAWLAAGAWCAALSGAAGTAMNASGRSKTLGAFTLAGGSLSLALCLAWIPPRGIEGAAQAQTLAKALTAASLFAWFCLRILRTRPWAPLLSVARAPLLAGALAGAAGIAVRATSLPPPAAWTAIGTAYAAALLSPGVLPGEDRARCRSIAARLLRAGRPHVG